MQAPNFTPSRFSRDVPSVLEDLTRQETKILELVAKGLTNKEIASCLSIEEVTVKTHRQNITRKADVKGTSEIRKFVREITPFLKNTTFILLFYYLSSIASAL